MTVIIEQNLTFFFALIPLLTVSVTSCGGLSLKEIRRRKGWLGQVVMLVMMMMLMMMMMMIVDDDRIHSIMKKQENHRAT